MNMEDNNYVDFEEAKPEKKSNKTVIIIAVVAVVLCCCCVIGGWVAWSYGDQLVQGLNLY
jgi:hypothetical protein